MTRADRSGGGGLAVGRRRIAPLVGVGLGTVIAMAAAIAAASASGLSIADAVADPQEVTDRRFLGIVSNIGVLVWGAAVSVCVFASLTIGSGRGPSETDDSGPGGHRLRGFFRASAVVAGVLLVDDFLLVHEFADDVVAWFVDFERTRRQKDLLEATVFLGYGVLFGGYALAYRDILRAAPDLPYLGAAFALFAVSAAVDFGFDGLVGPGLPDEGGSLNVEALIEDGAKLLGIVYFATFYFRIAHLSLTPGREAQPGSPVTAGDPAVGP